MIERFVMNKNSIKNETNIEKIVERAAIFLFSETNIYFSVNQKWAIRYWKKYAQGKTSNIFCKWLKSCSDRKKSVSFMYIYVFNGNWKLKKYYTITQFLNS